MVLGILHYSKKRGILIKTLNRFILCPGRYLRKVPPAAGLPGSSEDLKLASQYIDHWVPCRLVRHEPKFFTCVPARQASRGRSTRKLPANDKSYSPARQACRGLCFVGNDKGVAPGFHIWPHWGNAYAYRRKPVGGHPPLAEYLTCRPLNPRSQYS